MNKLIELKNLGQSVWYDNIERKLLQNGELKRLIDEDGITGVTSNPSIFEKAITSSGDYDADIKALAKAGKSAEQIYEEITVKDIIGACDLLDKTCQDSKQCDGYVSIEVSPDYAYDVEKTLVAARRIFKAVNRPNVLIKVPGTTEGFEASRQLIFEGININITLLFSQNDFVEAAGAYIKGLKKRLDRGLGIADVFSVASVFISRIDTKIDDMLKKMIDERTQMKDSNLSSSLSHLSSLTGKSAVANAKIIHHLHKKLFGGKDFSSLQEQGAKPQKIVWASTSAKNPAFPDTKYVDELIAPDTINTIPTQTLFAFKDHGKPKISMKNNGSKAQETIMQLRESGINITTICDGIKCDGVKSFAEAYKKALAAIAGKI